MPTHLKGHRLSGYPTTSSASSESTRSFYPHQQPFIASWNRYTLPHYILHAIAHKKSVVHAIRYCLCIWRCIYIITSLLHETFSHSKNTAKTLLSNDKTHTKHFSNCERCFYVRLQMHTSSTASWNKRSYKNFVELMPPVICPCLFGCVWRAVFGIQSVKIQYGNVVMFTGVCV